MTRSAGPALTRRPFALAVLGGALAALFTGLWVYSLEGVTTSGKAYVRTFDHNTRPLDVALAGGDGQAFAALAVDPTLARPEVFRDGAPEAAYRAQRPLASYAAWAISLGQPGLVPLALAVLFVIGQALAVGCGAALLRRGGGRPELALVLIVLPPALAAMRWFGPEPLGLALALAGMLFWQRRSWPTAWAAAALFALAALTRETNLIVPVMLGVVALVRRDRPVPMVATLTFPGAVWLTWAAVVHARLASWPWDAGDCRLADKPLGGLLTGAEHWPSRPLVPLAMALSVVTITVACLILRPRSELTWVVVGFAVLAVFMGDCVWRRWSDFTRPLLPLYAFALVALGTRTQPTPPRASPVVAR